MCDLRSGAIQEAGPYSVAVPTPSIPLSVTSRRPILISPTMTASVSGGNGMTPATAAPADKSWNQNVLLFHSFFFIAPSLNTRTRSDTRLCILNIRNGFIKTHGQSIRRNEVSSRNTL